jgi:hypothetical protein
MFDKRIDSLLVTIAYYESLRAEAHTLGLAGSATYEAIIEFCKGDVASAQGRLRAMNREG